MTFNVSRITETLFVGGGITPGNDELAYLKSQGVTAIISVAQGLDDTERAKAAGLDVLYIPWLDDGTAKDERDFHTALQWVLDLNAKRIAGGGRLAGVVAHCASGVNRGPLMATFLLAAMSGLPADEAYKVVKGMRPVVTAFEQPQYRSSVLRALAGVNPVVTGSPSAEPEQTAQVAVDLDADAEATAEASSEPAPAKTAAKTKGS